MRNKISSIIIGKAYVVGDDIDTDAIIPATYLSFSEPEFLAKHAMEGLDKNKYPIPFLVEGKCDYKIIIAGKNFGCGSSREHAVIALYGAGIKAVIAKSFARIYFRNSINNGMRVLESEENLTEEIKTGDKLEILLDELIIINQETNNRYKLKPLSYFIKKILEAGSLGEYVKTKT